ncbi:hypothetical protein [Bhargavaea cecembensis]|uniref:hypothetical protein n=1 Tax=Bhargavaea cecembensis TaxID=394098 RepID=UPI0015CF040A|nr:hypothetical protein [Bhargavaea cecembensis]
MKRHQQVVVNSALDEGELITTEGKVAAIGRDFVMLTDIRKRIWIPYAAIDSATIPYGFPTYSNPHQNHIYDNQLRQKLILNFGETVSCREELVRQFFEETFHTNLSSWKGTWVQTRTADRSYVGRLEKATKKACTIRSFRSGRLIPMDDLRFVEVLSGTDLLKRFAGQLMPKVFKRK